jgi:outer membrane biogenesis lipoprotein LolB
MQKYLFLAAVCLLLLAACAAPQSSIVPNESDKSKPNLASILPAHYYTTMGTTPPLDSFTNWLPRMTR